MCGITLVIHPDLSFRKALEAPLLKCLYPRGPDEQSSYHHPRSPVSYFHSRLNIIGGDDNRQPYVCEQDRHSIIYNGELYNSTMLASDYGLSVSPDADVRVLLHGLLKAGSSFLSDAHGMWAWCWYDEARNCVTISRDRYGIKPLYLGYCGQAFFISSEIKVAQVLAQESLKESREGRFAYFSLGYIPAPLSIYEDVWKLPAGAVLELPLTVIEDGAVDAAYIESHSSFVEGLSDEPREIQHGSLQEAADTLEELLLASLERRSDGGTIPAQLLSGGCDSTLLLAMQQKRLGRAPEVYTAIFDDESFNEQKTSRQTLRQLGIQGTEVRISAAAVAECFDDVCMQLDEPFADSSLLACMVLCKEVSQSHKVACSGDGADELFHGYRRYEYMRRIRRYAQILPQSLRAGLRTILPALPLQILVQLVALLSGDRQTAVTASGLLRALDIFSARGDLESYQRCIAVWQESPIAGTTGLLPGTDAGSVTRVMASFDFKYYLADDLLVKMDRSSMAYGLEVRVPYLDHTIVQFAQGLPDRLLYRGYHGKLLIKELLHRYAPFYDTKQRKQGFGVPLNTWLQGELKELTHTHLRAVLPELDPMAKEHINMFLQGKGQADQKIWSLLVYQLWRERQSVPLHDTCFNVQR